MWVGACTSVCMFGEVGCGDKEIYILLGINMVSNPSIDPNLDPNHTSLEFHLYTPPRIC